MASITKRIAKDGTVSWLITVFCGFDATGRKKVRKSETYIGSKKKARIRASEMEADRSKGVLVVERVTIGTLFDDLLREYKLNGKDKDHIEAGRIRTSLRPFFGSIDANKLTTKQVNAYVDKRKSEDRANATINKELSLLRHSLTLGMAADPAKVARAPKIPELVENNVRKGFFEQGEYKALRDALPTHVRPVLTLAYYTGMRKGEMLKLRWEQVDLVENVIRLEAGETKNGESRELPLDGELLETIRMQRAIRDAQHPTCEWVFFSDRGKQIQNFRGAWESACKSVGLWDPTKERKTKKPTSKKKFGAPTKLVHDLRRTGVRNLVRSGTPEKVCMLISGHKTRDTFERYNIVDRRDVKEAMRRLSLFHEANAAKSAEEQIPARFQHEPVSTVAQ